MLHFENRTGPQLGDSAPQYPQVALPAWFRDAKIGMFVHYGIYSVPGWATPGATPPGGNPYTHHRYAEWYANTVRIPGSPTEAFHRRTFGAGTSYEDLADRWSAESFDPGALAELAVAAGARYLVGTTKHHDGFCLWDTPSTPFNAARRGPRRDLIADLAAATRSAGLKFGTYFSGALDWHLSDFPPITSDEELFAYRRNDEDFARYAAGQLTELIDRFAPDVLWNDIDWPDGGKTDAPFGLAAVLRRYFDQVPDGVINDRWGIPCHGVLTREYTELGTAREYFEYTRGVGRSFGINRVEPAADTMTAAELVRLAVIVIASGGNLLINVGPDADGTVPAAQQQPLRGLGDFLRQHGEHLYGSTGIPDPHGGTRFAVTRTADGARALFDLRPGQGAHPLPAALVGVNRLLVPGHGPVNVVAGAVELPVTEQPVTVGIAD